MLLAVLTVAFAFLLAITLICWGGYFLFLIVLPLSCLWVGWKIGRLLDASWNTGAFRYLVPATSAALFVIWIVAGFKEFETSCPSVRKPVIHAKTSAPQEGFYVDTSVLEQYGAWRTLPTFDQLIDSRVFSYYEQLNLHGRGNEIPGTTYSRTSEYTKPGLGLKRENTDVLKSKYAFTVLRVRRIEGWWLPPAHTLTYGIRELSTNRVLAEADENIFGGWLYGLYKRPWIDPKNTDGGDFNYIACGYASPTISTWRPHDATQPEYQRYIDTDSTFLREVLIHAGG